MFCRTCKIGNNTLIGPSTQVHDEAQVIASTIGAKCSIGAGTVLRNAYIFDDVTIGPNCTLESCIVGAGVQVGEGSRIARGSLVADGVKLGQGTVLRPFERVSRRKQKPPMVGELVEDESDEGDADSELEEAEQSVHSAASHNPILDAERSRSDVQISLSFRRAWVQTLTRSCGPAESLKGGTRTEMRKNRTISTTCD